MFGLFRSLGFFSGAAVVARLVKRIDKTVAKLEGALDHIHDSIQGVLADHDDEFERHQQVIQDANDEHVARKTALDEKLKALNDAHVQGKKLIETISTIKNGTATCA